jgi:hypothetical protein
MDDKKLVLNSSIGLNIGQLAELQRMQVEGRVPMIQANNAKPEDFTSEAFRARFGGYRIAACDRLCFVVALCRRQFDPHTGHDFSDFTVQVFNQATFEMMTNRELYGGTVDGFQGLQVHILHDPEKKLGKV